MVDRLRISDIGGERLNLTGQELRLMSYMLDYPWNIHESADISTGSPTTGEFSIYIPFAKPLALRPYDFSIPADVMSNVELTMHTDTSLDIGSSAVTGGSSTVFKFFAMTHEEDTVEFKMRDQIFAKAMEAQTQGTWDVNGGYLAELLAYADGASGGASMANFTAHRIDGIQPDELEDFEMIQIFRLLRGSADNGTTPGGEVFDSPFTTSTPHARAVHIPHPKCKLSDLPYVSKSALIRVTTGVASSILVGRNIMPRNQVVDTHTARLYKVAPSSLRAKTDGKSRRARSSWGPRFKFITASGKAGSAA